MLYYYDIPNGQYSFLLNNDTKDKLTEKNLRKIERIAFKYFKNWMSEGTDPLQKARRKERRILSLSRISFDGTRELLKTYVNEED